MKPEATIQPRVFFTVGGDPASLAGFLGSLLKITDLGLRQHEKKRQEAAEKQAAKPPRSVKTVIADWIYQRVDDQNMAKLQAMWATELLFDGTLSWEELDRLLHRVASYRRVPEGSRTKGTSGEFFAAQFEMLREATDSSPPKPEANAKGDQNDAATHEEQAAGDQDGG